MATRVNLKTLNYRVESPQLVELHVRRNQEVDETDGGILLIKNNLALGVIDDTNVDAITEINIEGKSPDRKDLYFELKLKFQSKLQFEKSCLGAVESQEFASLLTQVVFTKLSSLIESLVWQMGYTGMTIDLNLTPNNPIAKVSKTISS